MAVAAKQRYVTHMKRTNLVLDEQVLEEAGRKSGVKTYSDVVNLALGDFVRRKTFARIDEFASTDVWEGSPEEKREDRSDVSRGHISLDTTLLPR